jgi:predicted RND superfamily exporter protein
VANQALMEGWYRNFPELVRSRLVVEERDEQLWRISVRVNAMDGADYGDLLDVIETLVNQFLVEINGQFASDGTGLVSAVLTGGVPMMYKAQHQVLNDLLLSFLTAFLLISIVMVIVLKGLFAGLVAMLPNIFPPLIVFGAMGWLGLPIEIGSVMTASVALGIAVDDTIHFLAWYRRGAELSMDKAESILYAYRNCAKSMIDTTLICGLGVSPFMFSVFMPTVRFARLMLILLLVGLVGDLLMLPAILAGPVGSLFRRRLRSKPVPLSSDLEGVEPLNESQSGL